MKSPRCDWRRGITGFSTFVGCKVRVSGNGMAHISSKTGRAMIGAAAVAWEGYRAPAVKLRGVSWHERIAERSSHGGYRNDAVG